MADTVPRMPEEDRPRLTQEELEALARKYLNNGITSCDRWSLPGGMKNLTCYAIQGNKRRDWCWSCLIPELVLQLDALAQRTVAAEDEAARMAGDEEGHLNKVEQMRMRAEQAEAKLAAIAEACEKYYGWGGMIEKDTIRRLLQEG